MSIINSNLPPDLLANTVVKHLDEPWSPEALGEAHHDLIGLGPWSMDHWGDNSFSRDFIKRPGEAFDPYDVPAVCRDVTSWFMLAAATLLTPDALEQSTAHVRYDCKELIPYDSIFSNQLHVDVSPHPQGSIPTQKLRLLALLVNDLPTACYQGGIQESDRLPFQGDIDETIVERRGLTLEELPLGNLFLMPLALPHFAQESKVHIPMRRIAQFKLLV